MKLHLRLEKCSHVSQCFTYDSHETLFVLFVLGIEGAETKETSTEWSSCWAEGAERRPEALLKQAIYKRDKVVAN